MINALKSFILSTVILLGTFSFGQSLNVSGGYTASWMENKHFKAGETNITQYGNEEFSNTTASKNAGIHGFNAAVGYEFPFGKRLSLETGIKFQTRGTNYKTVTYLSDNWNLVFSSVTQSKTKLYYFDVPMMLNIAFLIKDYRAYARTGLNLGLLAEHKNANERSDYIASTGETLTTADTQIIKYDPDEFKRRYTGGIILGIGVEYNGFYFETNYNAGFHTIFYNKYKYTHDLSFSVGYKIKFKGEK